MCNSITFLSLWYLIMIFYPFVKFTKINNHENKISTKNINDAHDMSVLNKFAYRHISNMIFIIFIFCLVSVSLTLQQKWLMNAAVTGLWCSTTRELIIIDGVLNHQSGVATGNDQIMSGYSSFCYPEVHLSLVEDKLGGNHFRFGRKLRGLK